MSRIWVRALGGVLLLALALPLAWAQGGGAAPAAKPAPPSAAADAHRREDIERHRQMARAHEEAARCLERGDKEAACQERLREACKGLAVGRFCGMRHGH